VANTSSVDGQAAFLGERTDHSHIDYFQGLEKFREPGLPCRLPASLERHVSRDPRLLELEREAREHPLADSEAIKGVKSQRVASHRKTLLRLARRRYQESWGRGEAALLRVPLRINNSPAEVLSVVALLLR
jgi:hypothetical protein